MHLEVSSDMGVHKLIIPSPTGPLDLRARCIEQAQTIIRSGFRQDDKFFQPIG